MERERQQNDRTLVKRLGTALGPADYMEHPEAGRPDDEPLFDVEFYEEYREAAKMEWLAAGYTEGEFEAAAAAAAEVCVRVCVCLSVLSVCVLSV